MTRERNSTRRSDSDHERSTRARRSTRKEKYKLSTERKLWWTVVGVCGTLGLILIFYQPVVDYIIGPKRLEQAYASEVTERAIIENIREHGDSSEVKDDERAEVSEQEDAIFDYESITPIMTLSHNPTVDADKIIGQMAIPDVDLKLPILKGVTQDILSSGAGTLKRDQTMGYGNYALISHNSRNPDVLFAPLHRVEKGHVVYLTDRTTVYTYEINDVTVIQPEDTGVIDNGPSATVTLLTCTPDGKERLFAQGDLIDRVAYDEADDEIVSWFTY